MQRLPVILPALSGPPSEFMKILFRVDAGSRVGFGHFYRSISLARRLRKNGHEVVFSFLESSFWSERIREGFDFAVVPLDQADSEEKTRLYIDSHYIDVYYVDAILNFSDGYVESLRRICKVVFYQNMSLAAPRADVFIYPSVMVNPGFFARFGPGVAIYRGLEYVFFHPDITQIPRKVDLPAKVRTVAVAAGGSDPLDTLRRIYTIIKSGGFEGLKFFFFYGSDYTLKKEIPRDCPVNVEFHMFNHRAILKADVLITAFGVSTYEFLYLRIPVIAYGHQSSNAIASDELAQASGALISLGEIQGVNHSSLGAALARVSRPEVRTEMIRLATSAIDINGVSRVAAIIEAAGFPQ